MTRLAMFAAKWISASSSAPLKEVSHRAAIWRPESRR
jgi:hypothetical protein